MIFFLITIALFALAATYACFVIKGALWLGDRYGGEAYFIAALTGILGVPIGIIAGITSA